MAASRMIPLIHCLLYLLVPEFLEGRGQGREVKGAHSFHLPSGYHTSKDGKVKHLHIHRTKAITGCYADTHSWGGVFNQ